MEILIINKICACGSIGNIQANIFLVKGFKNLRDGKELPRLNKQELVGRGVLILVIDDNAMIKVPCKAVYHHENQKFHQKFQHLFKSDLILLGNAATPGLLYTIPLQDKPSCISYLCSWLPDPSLKKYPCNNMGKRRCTLTNALMIKSENYLHLQTEQLLGS